jgi:hypothetical protein
MVQSASCFVETKSRKVENQRKRDLIAERVEIRVTSGGLSKYWGVSPPMSGAVLITGFDWPLWQWLKPSISRVQKTTFLIRYFESECRMFLSLQKAADGATNLRSPLKFCDQRLTIGITRPLSSPTSKPEGMNRKVWRHLRHDRFCGAAMRSENFLYPARKGQQQYDRIGCDLTTLLMGFHIQRNLLANSIVNRVHLYISRVWYFYPKK